MSDFIKQNNKDEYKKAVDAAAKVAMTTIGLLAENYARIICPVDTGRLRNSITSVADSETATIGTNVEYAAYVELSTAKMPAQPYLRPAIEDHLREYEDIIRNELRQG